MNETVAKENTARPVTPLSILVEDLHRAVEMLSDAKVPEKLADAVQNAYDLAAGIEPYLNKCSTAESPALAALAAKTASEDWSKRLSDGELVRQLEQEMLSGHVEGQTLKMFVYMTGAKRILEIGMFTGYSALAMAEALPEDGLMVACEVDEYVANFAKTCFQESPHGSKITVKVAPALQTMGQLADASESFDLVFIDADKSEYVDYYNLLLDTGLLAPKGFICVDNTLLQGLPYLLPAQPTTNGEAIAAQPTTNGEAIARFNQVVAEDPRVEQVILPLRDGVTIIRRK